jgi:DNA replicative helicase MCM subunit Mcm2 (Cdc46/Mcm family)
MLCRSKRTIDILQEYYANCRGIDAHGQGLSTVLMTLLRLCFASARLHLRESCDAVDCLLAIRLVEESRRAQHCVSVLDRDDLCQAQVAEASEDESSFGAYLEALCNKYASQAMHSNEL